MGAPGGAGQDFSSIVKAMAAAGALDATSLPVVQYVNSLLLEAAARNATAVHLDNGPATGVAIHAGGKVEQLPSPAGPGMTALCSRMKLIGGLDVARHDAPQQGKLELRIGGVALRFAVNSVPQGPHHESVRLSAMA